MQSAPSIKPTLHCDDKDSVLSATEKGWRTHRAKTGDAADFYTHLAQVLNTNGLVVDACDGLEVLEHCRRRNLPIIDILGEIEMRVRAAGYCGGALSLADYAIGVQQVYVFFDADRFRDFNAVKAVAAERTSLSA